MADELSDAQLVEELKSFGEVVKQPIDKKKRPILVKKLNHLRARKNVSNRLKKTINSRKKQNIEFSSEEDESEIEDVAAPFTASRSPGRKSLRQNTSAYTSTTGTIEISPSIKKTNLRSRRSVGLTAKDQPLINNYIASTPGPSGSRLYPDLASFTDAPGTSSSAKRSSWNFRRNAKEEDNTNDYKGDFSDTDPEESIYEVVNKSMNTTFPVASGGGAGADDDDEDGDEDEDDDFANESRVDYNTRFSSSRLRNHETSKLNSSTSTSPAKRNKTSNHVQNSFTEEEIRQFGFKTHEDSRKLKPQAASYVSTGILIIVAVFFVSLGMTYMYMRGDVLHGIMDVFTRSDDGNHYKSTLKKCNGLKDTGDCYTPDDEKLALQVADELDIHMTSGKDGSSDLSCDVGDAKKVCDGYLDKLHKNQNQQWKRKILVGSLTLILDNPEWNVRVFTNGGASATTVDDIARLETDPPRSFPTRIYSALYKILLGAIVLLCCFVFIMLGLYLWKRHLRSLEDERKQVFEMVEKIIDMVKDNYEVNQNDSRNPPYMAIQHVRDQLLPPSQRRKLLPLWEKAVQFIEANESRIRVETQNIQGEDFIVWRWLPTNAVGGKVWQGQAFGENNVSTGNTLHYSPTPCLKIRSMFDADVESADDWDVSVQDAVLEKCKGITGILHIHVDKNSNQGCVYMKCNSCETAYQVYRSLHGWWFDSRLVTVKYLRLELYHVRFPDSKKTTKPLKPSNNSMSSLSHPYHRSSLEMT